MPRFACRLTALSLGLIAALSFHERACAQPRKVDAPPPAHSSEPVFRVVTPKQNELTITERYAKVVETKARIVRVDGFDPEVIGVTALTPSQVRVQALKPGVTTIVLVDENAATWVVDVFVVGDVRHLQAYLTQFYPKSAVEAVAVRDAVVLRGWVSQPEHITEIVEIAEQFYPKVLNQMRVGGVQQVMLKVRVMEVQRAKIRQLGLNFLYKNKNGYLSSSPGNLTPLATAVAAVPTNGVVSPPTADVAAATLRNATGAFGIVGPHNSFQGFVEALKNESLLKILAEPELTTTNGRPANMLAGGEFPVLVPQSLGTTTIQWREFGVRLEAVPIILGPGRVRLDLQPEVSERDFTNAVQVNGLTVPGITTRRVNTQVEMRFGETFMLAGLLSMRNTASADKIPFLGELPWIGSAFRRVRYDEAETELVIMVTPELVQPVDPSILPPGGPGRFTDIPTDRELFRDGMIEVPRYGDDCVGCQGGTGIFDGGHAEGAPTPLNGEIPAPLTPGIIPPPEGPLGPGNPLPPAPAASKPSEIQKMGGFRPNPNPGRAVPPRTQSGAATSRNPASNVPVVRRPNNPETRRPGLIEP